MQINIKHRIFFASIYVLLFYKLLYIYNIYRIYSKIFVASEFNYKKIGIHIKIVLLYQLYCNMIVMIRCHTYFFIVY